METNIGGLLSVTKIEFTFVTSMSIYTGATDGDAYGAGVSRQASQGMFTQASCNAKSDEAWTSMNSLRWPWD